MSKYLYLLSKKQFKTIFFIVILIVTLLQALNPAGNPPINLPHFDKLLHVGAFFILSFLLNRSSSSVEKRIRNVLSLLAFGILIEILQSFTGYREVSIGDVIANLVGILLFQLTYSLLKFWQLQRRKKRA